MMEEDNSTPVSTAPDATTEVTEKLADISVVDQLQDAARESEASIKTVAHSESPQLAATTTPMVTQSSPSPPLTGVPAPVQIPQFTNPTNPYASPVPLTSHVSPKPLSATAATGSPLYYNPASPTNQGTQPHIFTPMMHPQLQTAGATNMSPPTQGGYNPQSTTGYPHSPPPQQMPHYSPVQSASQVPGGSSTATVDFPLDAGAPYQVQQVYTSQPGDGWFGGGLMNKLKNSVETVITVLDPGMKQYIHSGGDVDVVVTSDKETKVSPVREAFQAVFGKATVSGLGSQANVAAQPTGFTAGLKGAEERIENLRRSGLVDERQTLLSVENFLAELLPDKWFDMGCILLKDPMHNINLQVFTQATPVPPEYVQLIQDRTPADYPLRWSGYSVTIGEIVSSYMPHIPRSEWHLALCGVPRQEMIFTAAKTLAGLYKKKLPPQSS